MGFAVVQWKDENAVSTVNDKDIVLEEEGDEILKGETVMVSTRTKSKGNIKLFKATVLELFAKKNQALDFEKDLTKLAESKDGAEKRKRKPSKKVLEASNDDNTEIDTCTDEPPQKKTKKISNGNPQEKSLQNSVQAERVLEILTNKRKAHVPPQPTIQETPPQTPQQTPPTRKPTSKQTPPLPSFQTIPSHTLTSPQHAVQQTPPQYIPQSFNCQTPTSLPTHSHSIIANTPASQNRNKPPHTPSFPEQIPAYNNNSYMIHTMETPHRQSLFSDLLSEDEPMITSYTRKPSESDWQECANQLTDEIQNLRAEVEQLKMEVRRLKRSSKSEAKESTTTAIVHVEETEMSQLSNMVKHTPKPLDGLKLLLYSLFNEEDIRTSSLKGVFSASTGLDKKKLDQLYSTMEERYNSIQRKDVDLMIRGQQKKLRDQYKKLNK